MAAGEPVTAEVVVGATCGLGSADAIPLSSGTLAASSAATAANTAKSRAPGERSRLSGHVEMLLLQVSLCGLLMHKMAGRPTTRAGGSGGDPRDPRRTLSDQSGDD